MRDELDKKLCEDFPILYSQRHLDMMSTCMCWGFDCDDGWEPIIRHLSANLEWLNYHGAHIEAVQVKEKYGTLRFYESIIEGGMRVAEIVWDLIDHAEIVSGQTCEKCGNAGKRRSGGWIRTLCDDCAKELGYEVEDETQTSKDN